MIENKGHD